METYQMMRLSKKNGVPCCPICGGPTNAFTLQPGFEECHSCKKVFLDNRGFKELSEKGLIPMIAHSEGGGHAWHPKSKQCSKCPK